MCGLKWSPDNRQLASGGNDNQLCIWDLSNPVPTLKFTEHSAAVKAIAWSPHQHGLLASGGGTADRCIRFWNTATNTKLTHIDAGSQVNTEIQLIFTASVSNAPDVACMRHSTLHRLHAGVGNCILSQRCLHRDRVWWVQVCNLAWSKNVNEIVSTHGYSQNQIIVWKYPTMNKLATLTGHTLRVLYLAMSPDGQTIVTGAGDETLRFWNVFPGPKANTSSARSTSSVAMHMRTHIR